MNFINPEAVWANTIQSILMGGLLLSILLLGQGREPHDISILLIFLLYAVSLVYYLYMLFDPTLYINSIIDLLGLIFVIGMTSVGIFGNKKGGYKIV